LTFTPNDWDLPQLVQVTGVDDQKADGSVPYSVILSRTSSSDPSYNRIKPPNAAVTNQNYETPAVLVWPASNLIVTPGASTTFEVGLSVAPAFNVSIAVSSSNSAVGSVSTSVLVFTPSNWSKPQTVTVTGQNMWPLAGNTSFSVKLGNAASFDSRFNGIGGTTVSATDVVNRATYEAAAEAEASAYIQVVSNATTPVGNANETPAMLQQDAQVLALVPFSGATNIAIADGNWSDPNTWMNQQVPGSGANVWIMPGRTVTVDQQVATPVNWIRVTGTLRFNPHANTLLRADTVVVDHAGTLMMGNQAEPIDADKTAVLSFTDSGPINPAVDPHYWGRGLISLGTNQIQGAAMTAFAPLAFVPALGDSTLTFTTAPTNWHVGDTLVLGGEVGFAYGEQEITIAGISPDGKTMTLSTPVNINVRGYNQPDEQLFVPDLSRNVVFQSENTTTDPEQNGHVMFLHTPAVTVRYAYFSNVGRTAGGPDANNHFESTISGVNPLGRYGLYLDNDGAIAADGTQVVQGSVVDGSPGWGFVSKGSHAIISDDVAYEEAASGFATEDGNESGVFARDLAMGSDGFGFWLHGAGMAVTDSVAVGYTQEGYAGFYVLAATTVDTDGNYQFFSTSNLANPSLVDPYTPAGTVAVENVPMYFARNIAYANYAGYSIWDGAGSIDPVRADTIEGGVLWNNLESIQFVYTNTFTVRDVHMYSDTWSNNGITGDAAPANMIFDNNTIIGFLDGIDAPVQGPNRISDGFYNNLTDVHVPFGAPDNSGMGVRVVDMRGLTFGTVLPPGHPTWWTQTDIALDESNAAQDTGTNLWALFAPNQILLNGQQLFFNNQLPGTVISGTGVPFLDGQTNAQLYAQYMIAIGGEPAPQTVTTVSGITGGVVGAMVFVPPLVPVEYATRLDNWLTGLPGPLVNLVPGWNLVPVIYHGQQRYMFVYGP
jgi:hypothetical protein